MCPLFWNFLFFHVEVGSSSLLMDGGPVRPSSPDAAADAERDGNSSLLDAGSDGDADSGRPADGGRDGGSDASAIDGGSDASAIDGALSAPELRPAMLPLAGGTFTLGSNDGFGDETPAVEVTLSPFALCETEVTQAQFEEVMFYNPACPGDGCGADHPVHLVSWYDALSYLNTLSLLEGLERCYHITPTGVDWPEHDCPGYRLPTEAEWEYAARAGTTTDFSFGDDPALLDDYAWNADNVPVRACQPVRRLAPNPWGLYDMHGNLYEWVWDAYGNRYYEDLADRELVVDPTGSEPSSTRVLRGGSYWESQDTFFRCAARHRLNSANGSDPSVGFRCARSLAD
jgi:formylglycine-generating enzyme required for sulfatase activity